jgi:hypothetical protein
MRLNCHAWKPLDDDKRTLNTHSLRRFWDLIISEKSVFLVAIISRGVKVAVEVRTRFLIHPKGKECDKLALLLDFAPPASRTH